MSGVLAVERRVSPLRGGTGPAVPWRALVALVWRLVRRGSALMCLTAAGYMALEVLSFRAAYPDQASRERLLHLSNSTAVRMMQGQPGAVDTPGGFAVWDGGWMLMIILACWAVLSVGRIVRGEEDSGRADLVLSRPGPPTALLATQVLVLDAAAVAIGASSALAFVVLGEPLSGALVWGAGLASLLALTVSLTAVLAQVLEPRRRVSAAGLALLAATFVTRVVAHSSSGRAWLLLSGPFGWVERLRAFSGDRWVWLLPPLAGAVVLGAVALLLCERRDAGAGLLRPAQHHRSSFRLLGSAAGFGWREGAGTLAAWTAVVGVVAGTFGLMTDALVDFIRSDPTYQRMLESMGMDMSAPAVGYMSYIAVFLALPLAAFPGWRLGAVRQEEADGRLDNLLVRGVRRADWLARTAGLAFVAALVILVVSLLGLWGGAALVNAPLTAGQIAEPMLGTVPLVALFTGIAVGTFGLAPRLTVVVPVSVAVLGYLLDTLGTAMSLPHAVLGLSPFHHLARLPGSPLTWTAATTMTGLGVTAAVVGVVAFARRDLRGA